MVFVKHSGRFGEARSCGARGSLAGGSAIGKNALAILLAGLTIIFLFAVATLEPFAVYAGSPVSTVILIALEEEEEEQIGGIDLAAIPESAALELRTIFGVAANRSRR